MVYPSPGLVADRRYQRGLELADQLRVEWRGTLNRTGRRVTTYRTPPTRNTDVGWLACSYACTCPDRARFEYGACKHMFAASIRDGQLAAVSA